MASPRRRARAGREKYIRRWRMKTLYSGLELRMMAIFILTSDIYVWSVRSVMLLCLSIYIRAMHIGAPARSRSSVRRGGALPA